MTPRLSHRKRVAFAIGIVTMFALLGFGCRGGTKVIESLPQIDMEYWTVWDDADDYAEAVTAYRAQHPNVRITVRKFAFDEYEDALIQAWARGEGPDIFSMGNAYMGKYTQYIQPLPASLSLPTLSVSGGCSKNIRIVEQPKATLVPEQLDDLFIPVIADDVVFNNEIYGLPLATDVLALFYNKELLNAAKIVSPPRTWQEFVDHVDSSKSTLTREESGEIVQAGASLGTADNVNRAVDILSTLMMQSGARMTDPTGTRVTFSDASPTDKTFNPGLSALNFYTAFANPLRVTYTWNDKLPEAQEAFAAGQVAYFVGYSYQVDIIRRQNPRLDFDIAPLPQISLNAPEINYANYWVETVAKQSEHPNEAWDFLLFLTTDEERSRAYLAATGKPTALKTLIEEQKQDLALEIFADQLLVAKSWYHGADPAAMEESLLSAVRDVLAGEDPAVVLNRAALQTQETLALPE